MSWNDLIGMRLDQYEIVSELGRGGSSRVYHAHDHERDSDVAIKVIPNDAEDRALFIRRFQREVAAVQKLHDPNIVAVFGAGENDEFVYLVMQCVTGGTLRKQLNGPLPVSDAAGYVVQIAHALQHAHERGIIHRDVKPSNMLLEYPGSNHLLLTDFGIAKIQGARGLTKSGTTIGTPEYMSPEQAEGRDIDERSDIYALGCVLYETLAGRPPFRGSTAVSVLFQQVHSRPAYIRGFNPGVPAELVHILEIALAKRPDERYESADAFARALLPFAGDLPNLTAQPSEGKPIVIAHSKGFMPSQPLPPSKRPSGSDVADRDTVENARPPTRRGVQEEATAPMPAISARKTMPPAVRVRHSHTGLPVSRPRKIAPPSRSRKTIPPYVRVRRSPTFDEMNPPLGSPNSGPLVPPAGEGGAEPPAARVSDLSREPLSLPIRSRPARSAVSGTVRPGSESEMPARGERGPNSQPGAMPRKQVPDSRIPATWPQPRRPRRRVVGLVAAAVVLALFSWLALNATGHGIAFGDKAQATVNRQTPASTATLAPTATAAPTGTAGPRPTATPTQQQILNQEASASFRSVIMATFNDGACSRSNSRSTFSSGEAIYVNLCTSGGAVSAPMTVAIRHNGQTVYTLVYGRYISPSSSYYYYTTHVFNSGTYDVLVTLNINGATAVARDLALYIN